MRLKKANQRKQGEYTSVLQVFYKCFTSVTFNRNIYEFKSEELKSVCMDSMLEFTKMFWRRWETLYQISAFFIDGETYNS